MAISRLLRKIDERALAIALLVEQVADAVVAHRQVVLPHRALGIVLGEILGDLEAVAIALDRRVERALGRMRFADAIVRHRQIALQPHVLRATLQQRLDLALGLRVGGHRLVGLFLRCQHVAQHGVAAIARQPCVGAAVALVAELDLAPERRLRRIEIARAQIEDARQHLRFGIFGRQIRRPGVGGQRIGDAAVEQGECTELAPIADLAAVQLAVGRAVTVQALVQELLGLRPMPPRLHHHRAGDRLEVPLEGFAGAHGGCRVDAVGEQRCGLGQALAQPILQQRRLVPRFLDLDPHDLPATAHQDCGAQQDQDTAGQYRQRRRPRVAEPGRQLPDQLDCTLQEPPELHATPSHTPPPRRTVLLRQWDKLLVVTGHEREALTAPVFFSLLDAILG